MKIAIASDHAGFSYKEQIKTVLVEQGHEVHDFGTHSAQACDYPDFIRPAPLAAAKLVQLTESENQETARKACLDIISRPALAAKRTEQPSETQAANTQQPQQLPPQLPERTISRLLAALADEKQLIKK